MTSEKNLIILFGVLMLSLQSYRKAFASKRPEGRLTTHAERYTLAALLSPLDCP